MNDTGQNAPVFRGFDLIRDRGALFNFDASFTTDRIYRVDVTEMAVELVEEVLEAPLHKTYPMAPVVFELTGEAFDGKVIIAETGGEVAGFAVMKYMSWNRRALLAHLYVVSDQQRKGLGRKLMEKAVEFAKENAARCIWLETQNINYPAVQFYKKMGFRFCGFDDTLYDPSDVRGEAALFFAMDI